jgi:hypothetical protein
VKTTTEILLGEKKWRKRNLLEKLHLMRHA